MLFSSVKADAAPPAIELEWFMIECWLETELQTEQGWIPHQVRSDRRGSDSLYIGSSSNSPLCGIIVPHSTRGNALTYFHLGIKD